MRCMHICFFDTSEFDEVYVRKELKDHDVFDTKEHLTLELAKTHADCEVLSVFVYSKVTREIMEAMPKLKLIATRSTGYDHIDAEAAKEKGIAIATVPLYGENTVAEHTFALILSLSRNVHKSYVRSLQGDHTIEGLMGFDLKGKTLGVVGAGKIGQHVIRIGRAFGMHVQAFDLHQDDFLADILDFEYVSLEELYRNADIVSLHVPYNPHTHHLINAAAFKQMKHGTILINTSRGPVVETEALLAALEEGIIGGAGLDVLEGEDLIMEEHQLLYHQTTVEQRDMMAKNMLLLHRDNVVFTPHIAFYSKEALERIICTTITNITDFAKGEPHNVIS